MSLGSLALEPSDFLPALSGLLHATVAAYLVLFRPRTRVVLSLAASVLFLGLAVAMYNVHLWAGATMAWIGIGSFLFLLSRFPTPVRRASLSGIVLAVAIAHWAFTMLFLLSGGVERSYTNTPTTLHLLFGPASAGTTIITSAAVFVRLRDLPEPRDDRAHAAAYVYLFPLTLVIIGGGMEFGRLLSTLFDPSRSFFPADPDLVRVAIGTTTFWFLPTIIAIYCISRWNWWFPAGLIGLGILSYLPLILQPNLDPATIGLLRIWGAILGPAVVMYAQARWAPFSGEPARVGPTVAVTGFTALFTYAFAFLFALTLSPSDALGLAIAPVVALVGAAIATIVVLPGARKLDLRQTLARTGGSGALQPGAVLLGRYRIVRLLGEGGQGTVYEAADKKNGGERVVLKALPDTDAVLEAGILKDLHHPNIVEFVDVVKVPGFTLLVLEYATGGTLRGLLTRRAGHIPREEANTIVDGILSGLAQAHARGVAHRDVKPENVLLDAKGVPKLADFGVARQTSTAATANATTRGTLGYLAPEQVRGDAGDVRSDVYAAGMLVYEVMTGKQAIPSQGDDDFLTRKAILQQSPKLNLPPGLSGITRVLRRALSKDPNERPADAADLLRQLKAARPVTA